MNGYTFINPSPDEKGLNGMPKIAACAELVSVLRESETKTLKSP